MSTADKPTNQPTNQPINQPTNQNVQIEKIDTKDYLNKSINDIIMNYFSFLNPKEKKTMGTLLFGISILIGIDVFKTIVHTLLIDNKKQICDTIITNVKNINYDNFVFYFLKFYNFFCKLS